MVTEAAGSSPVCVGRLAKTTFSSFLEEFRPNPRLNFCFAKNFGGDLNRFYPVRNNAPLLLQKLKFLSGANGVNGVISQGLPVRLWRNQPLAGISKKFRRDLILRWNF